MIAAKPLKQLYQPLILGSKKVDKTHLISANILRQWIKKVNNSLFVSCWLVRLGRLFWLFSSIPDADYKHSQRSRMELFAKIFNGLKPLTTFSKAWSYMFDQALDMFVYRTREDISNLLRNGRTGARKWSLRREDRSLKLERYVTVERFLFINYVVFHDNHQYS